MVFEQSLYVELRLSAEEVCFWYLYSSMIFDEITFEGSWDTDIPPLDNVDEILIKQKMRFLI